MSDDFVETVQLVRRAQDGDRAALESLFERYLPRVRQIVALRMGFQPSRFDQHEDLVQEALFNTFKNLDRYEERSHATFRHWISQCAVNSIRQHFRHAGAKKRGAGKVRLFGSFQREDTSAIVFQGADPTPSDVYGRKELLERVELALLEMKEHWREVIIQRLFCEMSYSEIGKEMGIRQEATVRRLYSRAMSALRASCDPES